MEGRMLGISREYIYLLTPHDTTHGFSQFQLKTHMRASLSMDLSSCRYFSFAGCVYQFFCFNNKKSNTVNSRLADALL